MTIEEAIKILTGYIGGKIDPESTELYHAVELAVNILESKPSLPSNLDEAAEEFTRSEYSSPCAFGGENIEEWVSRIFKAGAKWMAGQGVKIGETEIYLEDDGGEPPYNGTTWLELTGTEYPIPEDKFKDRDKVDIILLKKQ